MKNFRTRKDGKHYPITPKKNKSNDYKPPKTPTFFVQEAGTKFGKQQYMVVGANIKSHNKEAMERYAKLKNTEERLANEMLKPNADVVKLSNQMEEAREEYRKIGRKNR